MLIQGCKVGVDRSDALYDKSRRAAILQYVQTDTGILRKRSLDP
jgi:hypothetical protein